jgi:hypothetical protein
MWSVMCVCNHGIRGHQNATFTSKLEKKVDLIWMYALKKIWPSLFDQQWTRLFDGQSHLTTEEIAVSIAWPTHWRLIRKELKKCTKNLRWCAEYETWLLDCTSCSNSDKSFACTTGQYNNSWTCTAVEILRMEDHAFGKYTNPFPNILLRLVSW